MTIKICFEQLNMTSIVHYEFALYRNCSNKLSGSHHYNADRKGRVLCRKALVSVLGYTVNSDAAEGVISGGGVARENGSCYDKLWPSSFKALFGSKTRKNERLRGIYWLYWQRASHYLYYIRWLSGRVTRVQVRRGSVSATCQTRQRRGEKKEACMK